MKALNYIWNSSFSRKCFPQTSTSNTHNLHSSLKTGRHDFYPSKFIGTTLLLYILIFKFLDSIHQTWWCGENAPILVFKNFSQLFWSFPQSPR